MKNLTLWLLCLGLYSSISFTQDKLITSTQTGDIETSANVLETNSWQYKNSLSVGRYKINQVNSEYTSTFYCTATLISESHVLLNHHCIRSMNGNIKGGTVSFGYVKGNSAPADEYVCDELVGQDEEMDSLILKCQGEPGLTWGWVTIAEEDLPLNDNVYMVHHPQGTPQKFSTGINKQNTASEGSYSFWWSTIPSKNGSSGALIFSKSSHQAIMQLFGMSKEHGLPSMGTKSADLLKFIRKHLGEDFPYNQSNFTAEQIEALEEMFFYRHEGNLFGQNLYYDYEDLSLRSFTAEVEITVQGLFLKVITLEEVLFLDFDLDMNKVFLNGKEIRVRYPEILKPYVKARKPLTSGQLKRLIKN